MELPSPTSPEPPAVADFDALTRAARQERCLSENTLLAYQRAWRRLLAWSGASRIDPVMLTQEQAARFYREMVAASGRTAPSSQVQARAAMAFAYEQWDRPNPFARIKPPKSGSPPPVGYLQAHDLARLLDFLGQQQATYGESLTYHLAAALFYTCSRYSEIANLRWSDCLLDGNGRIVALRIKGKGSVHSTLPVNAVLSGVLSEWRTIQEQHRGMKIFAARGLKFCRSEYVFAGPGGEPYTNQSFNAHLGRACKDLRLQTILTAHGLRHSAATILLNDQGKNLREVQEALRHRDIRTTARYTHVAPEHTRGTMEALGGSLPALSGRRAVGGNQPRKIMTPSESAFLERAVVQLLFVSGREYALESLREKLRELFVQEADATVRAAASVGGFELLQVLLKTTQKLEKLGLRLNIRAGSVRITTAEVRPPTLRDYFAALLEQSAAERGSSSADHEEAEGPLSTTGLEVLACIAFKQPLGLSEINGYFTTDKRAVVHRLQHLGLVDCRKAGETGRTVWMTTGEFLRRFNLQSLGDLDRLWNAGGEADAA